MPKQKTSFVIDDDFWKEWLQFVIRRTGSTRKVSDEMEKAMKEYLAKYNDEE